MRAALSIIAFFCAGALCAQSPITISNANMPSSGDTLRYSNAQISSLGNYTQTGANYSWNFSSLVPTSQGVRNFKASFQTPYAFFFLGLNEYGEKIADTLGAGPLVMTNYYDFYKKQTSPVAAFIADGVGITFSAVPVPSYYSDKDELYMFPMSYPQYDSTTFKFTTASNSLIPIQYSKTGYRITVVDGWGSITTPYGTANCLRLITTQYSQDSVKNNILPLLSFGFPNYQRSYQWMTTSTKIPFLEITGNLVGNNFTPTQARYRDNARTITGIQQHQMPELAMYPNPVKDYIFLNIPAEKNISAEIMSIAGQLVSRQGAEPFGGAGQKLNMSSLPQGLYLMKISFDNNSYYFKFIKE
jgi:hypothetical protein